MTFPNDPDLPADAEDGAEDGFETVDSKPPAGSDFKRLPNSSGAMDSGPFDTIEQPESGEFESSAAQSSIFEAIKQQQSSRYRVLKLHAQGGLGAVYRARDGELKRIVAVKEIKAGTRKDERAVERFVFEAEVTGALEHPGIVPVYGLGRYPDGRPYYAMRFVKGKPLSQIIRGFHDAHDTSQATTFLSRPFYDLLRQLIDACNAIHYAHSRNVLHRDIKPDNIMVGRYGETLVVDWGLAKLISEDHSPTPAQDNDDADEAILISGSNTHQGSAMGTLQYMSPEQSAGRHSKLTAASDVYSLGAVLFSIITNAVPIESKSGREVLADTIAGKIRRVEQLNPMVPRPLRSICRKAMSLAPQDRYASALALADDLERWLADQSVLAHRGQETWLERVGRWTRRHRAWATAIAASVIAIGLISLAAAIFINQARQREQVARQKSLARYVQSRQAIDGWLVQGDRVLKYFPGADGARMSLLAQASADYEALAANRGDDELASDPELEQQRISAVIRRGDIAAMMRDQDAAAAFYERAIAESQDLNAPPLEARALNRLGILRVDEANFSEAETFYTRAIKRASESAATEVRGSARTNLGELKLRRRDFAGAAGLFDQAMEDLQTLPASRETELNILKCDLLASRAALEQNELTLANDRCTQAMDAAANLVARDASDIEALQLLVSSRVTMATIHRFAGDRIVQGTHLDAATSASRRLLAAVPGAPAMRLGLGTSLLDAGLFAIDDRDFSAAEPFLEEAHAIATALIGEYGQELDYVELLAASRDAWGQSLLAIREDASVAVSVLAAAESTYRDLATAFSDIADYPIRLAIAQSHHARAIARSGEDELAKQTWEASLARFADLVAQSPDDVGLQTDMAETRFRFGTWLEDDELTRQAIEQWKSVADPIAAPRAMRWMIETMPDGDAAFELAEQVAQSPTKSSHLRRAAASSLATGGKLDLANQVWQFEAIPESKRTAKDFLAQAAIARAEGDAELADELTALAEAWIQEHAPFDK